MAVHDEAMMMAIDAAPGLLRQAMPILTGTTIATAVMTIPSDERRAGLMPINQPARYPINQPARAQVGLRRFRLCRVQACWDRTPPAPSTWRTSR